MPSPNSFFAGLNLEVFYVGFLLYSLVKYKEFYNYGEFGESIVF